MTGEKFMPDMNLRQPGFRYSACGPFTKNKDRIQKFKVTRDSMHIYQNELDKIYFQNDLTYGDFKDLPKNRGLRDKAFNIAKTPKYDGYQRDLVSQVYRYFNQETPSRGAVKSEFIRNQQ